MKSPHGTRPSSRRDLVVAAFVVCLGAGTAFAQDDTTAEFAASASAPTAAPKPEIAQIPMRGAGSLGGDVNMVTQVFKPPGSGPFPTLVFSHGRAGSGTERAQLTRPISTNQVRYWLGKGYAVVAPIRVGYGATGGPDAELNGARFDSDGQCRSRPDFRSAADAGSKAVLATVDWLHAQTWADVRHIVLEGQSAGGLATVAAAARRPAGVIAYINFAGGAGGNPERSPGRSCDPDQLTAIYTELGQTTVIPNLWIYAENDQYFGADAPVAWHAGFAKGGSRTRFIHAPPVADGDGHGLSRHATRLWAGYLNEFLGSVDGAPASK